MNLSNLLKRCAAPSGSTSARAIPNSLWTPAIGHAIQVKFDELSKQYTILAEFAGLEFVMVRILRMQRQDDSPQFLSRYSG